jgi:hypothetical protein
LLLLSLLLLARCQVNERHDVRMSSSFEMR